ncbi:MAG: sigma-70 family RNA polymerase sigma factor [Myxococcota bacterium]
MTTLVALRIESQPKPASPTLNHQARRAPRPDSTRAIDENEQLAWVASEARRMARRLPRHVQPDDLLGAGCVGLMVAARQYDPARCADFQAFARLKIRAAMLDELRELDLLPRRARASLNHLARAERRFTAEKGRAPNREELGAEARMSAERVEALMAMAERARTTEPLEAADAQGRPDTTLLEYAEQRETSRRLAQAVERLTPRQQAVLAAYYQADMTFKEIGQRLGVTESRVCQLHTEAVKALRAFL